MTLGLPHRAQRFQQGTHRHRLSRQRAITQKIMADKAFVGLLRGTVNKDGEDMVNIGAVMEYGATIKHPNGATIIIPARPFLHPVMEKYREQILQNYREAIRSAL